ncbi:MAG TPA: hypothetical protein VGB75_04640 [Jatrophihabitans sp.]|jgi:hypothetical protein|uniref:hypothetical protein n=1 Tax=Jatrophihabitans sp. TaxID=1932789 RepID=UPI002F076269
MNDLDTTIKNLINSAVDHELAGHRSAPPLDLPALSDRSRSDRPLARWAAPVLAASVAALLTVGTVLAIGSDRDRRSNQAANSASPTASASPSVSISKSLSPDQEKAARAYAEAVAGAREASEVAGVSVGPLPPREAAGLKDTGLISGGIPSSTEPEPGKIYSFTLSYLAGPSDNPPSVLTTGVQDVASGSCAQPFLARPGHAYQIRCQVMFMTRLIGKATLTLRTPTGTTVGSMNLTEPGLYADAVASAPEASKVAGVSDRPATADERHPWETLGILKSGPAKPDPGRSYPVTLLYIPASNAPPVTVLAIKFEDVAVGRCPGPFRTRPGHAYLLHCQVTYRAGAKGMAYYDLIGPRGGNATARSGVGLSPA